MNLLKIEIDFIDHLSASETTVGPTKKINNLIHNQSKLTKTEQSALLEIFKIESEKKKLRNAHFKEVQKIAKLERVVYKERETLLLMELTNLLDEKFVVNPLLKIHGSHWNWVLERIYNPSNLLENTKEPEAENFFFAFLVTGSMDPLAKSTILELSLNEYQHFLLQYFQKPRTVLSAIHFFEDQFEPNSEQERQHLRTLIEGILRELIFKTYILQSNTGKAVQYLFQ